MNKSIYSTLAISGVLSSGLLMSGSATARNAGMDAGISNFSVQDGVVVPHEKYLVRFRLLGAELKDGSADAPVAVKFQIGDNFATPFGDFESKTVGNVNDHEFPKDMETSELASSNAPLAITARSWTASGTSPFITVSTNENSDNVIMLRNGDPVPDIAGMDDQDDISEIIVDYIDQTTNTVRLYDDEVIVLFELGTTDLTSSAADFQDLVVLVTLAEHSSRFHAGVIPSMLVGD